MAVERRRLASFLPIGPVSRAAKDSLPPTERPQAGFVMRQAKEQMRTNRRIGTGQPII